MLPHYIIQNVSLLRWYRKSRWMINQGVQKVPWKYVIGITIATPFIAIAQGTYLLHEYRRNHGDAPTPDVPSRGLVVVKRQSYHHHNSSAEEPPGIILNPSPLKRFATMTTVAAVAAVADSTTTGNGTTNGTSVTKEMIQTTLQNKDTVHVAATAAAAAADDVTNAYDDDDEHTMVTTNTRPLRILIIGDSLAAGVGTSRSSTPILPETIAQALSKALDGRAVLWTCFGVPGQTSSEIVHSIQHLEDIFVSTTKNHSTLLQRFNEWQMTQRQLAQSRIESAKRKTKEWMEHRKHMVDDDKEEHDKEAKNDRRTRKNGSVANENHNNNRHHHEDDDDDDTAKSSNRLVRWWKRTSVQFRNDMRELRTIFKRDDDDDDDANHNSNNGNPTYDISQGTINTLTTTTTTMSLSEQAMMIGEYDIAIVLTGLNDLKESYLPFMRSHERTKELRQLHQQHQSSSSSSSAVTESHNDQTDMGTPTFNDIMKGELICILNALLDRRMHKRSSSSSSSSAPTMEHGVDMTHPDQSDAARINHTICDDNDNKNDTNNDSKQPPQPHRHENKGPLIVFPALPYQPTILSQYPPLSWFMIPLLDMVDANKKMLSELYPGLVLFVESPDIHDWSNATLAQRGTVWEDFCVLFKLNDIAQDANERIIQLMKRHYDRWVIRDGDDSCTTTTTSSSPSSSSSSSTNNDTTNPVDTNTSIADTIPHPLTPRTDDDCLYELDMMGNVTIRQQPPSLSLGALMVAADGIHPSDIGYDMWGRHIADAIIKEWDKVG